jgi:tRNA(fMet)-specific endonuclease VapC
VALERRRQNSLAALAALFPDAPVAVAAITVSELLVGAYLANTHARRQERESIVASILDDLEPIPFDLAIARVHAELVAQMRRGGVTIGAHDLQIAATALAGGHEVVTVNTRDFERVPNLVVRAFPASL